MFDFTLTSHHLRGGGFVGHFINYCLYKAFPCLTLMIIIRAESHVHRLMKTFSIFLKKKKAYVNTLLLISMHDSVLQCLDPLDPQIFVIAFLQSQVVHVTLLQRCLEQRL